MPGRNLGSGEVGGKAPWVPDRRSKSSEVRWVSLGKKTAWGVNRVTRNKVEVRDDKHGLEAVAAMKVAKGTCVSRRLTLVAGCTCTAGSWPDWEMVDVTHLMDLRACLRQGGSLGC